MMEVSLNRCKRMEGQAGDFLEQLVVKLEVGLLILVTCLSLQWEIPQYERKIDAEMLK